MLKNDFIAILCCPESQQKVSLANESILASINLKITGGKCTNRDGTPVTTPLDGGLIREDGKYLYPIRSDIPIMLAGDAIAIE